MSETRETVTVIRKMRGAKRKAAGTKTALTISARALPGMVTATSWTAPKQMTFDQWLACGRRMMSIGIASSWWLADWWRSNPAYGERVEAAKEWLPIGIESLRTYASVAANVSIRIDTLSFTHHRVVAGLPPDQQRFWLDRAEREKLSVRALHAAITAPDVLTNASEEPAAGDDAEAVRIEAHDEPPAVHSFPAERAQLVSFNSGYACFAGLLSVPPQKFFRAHASPAMLMVVATFLLRVAAAKGMTVSERQDLLTTLRHDLKGIGQEIDAEDRA